MKDEPWLIDKLEKFRRRPGLYLAENTSQRLEAFINGYADARIDNGLTAFHESESDILLGFSYWLVVREQTKKSVMWQGVIEHLIDSSKNNIFTFYKLFDEYLEQRKSTSFNELKGQYEKFLGRKA